MGSYLFLWYSPTGRQLSYYIEYLLIPCLSLLLWTQEGQSSRQQKVIFIDVQSMLNVNPCWPSREALGSCQALVPDHGLGASARTTCLSWVGGTFSLLSEHWPSTRVLPLRNSQFWAPGQKSGAFSLRKRQHAELRVLRIWTPLDRFQILACFLNSCVTLVKSLTLSQPICQ